MLRIGRRSKAPKTVRIIEMKLKQNWNKTVWKLFRNCFETVLFQFHFSCANSLSIARVLCVLSFVALLVGWAIQLPSAGVRWGRSTSVRLSARRHCRRRRQRQFSTLRRRRPFHRLRPWRLFARRPIPAGNSSHLQLHAPLTFLIKHVTAGTETAAVIVTAVETVADFDVFRFTAFSLNRE